MIVQITCAKVGHRQAPFKQKPNHKVGLLLWRRAGARNRALHVVASGLPESLRLSIHRRSRTPLTALGCNSKTGQFTDSRSPVKCEGQQDSENKSSQYATD